MSCASWDPLLLTGLGAAISIFLAAAGSALASAHAGLFAVRRQTTLSFAPIVIAGVLAIYGIIISVLLVGQISNTTAEEPMSQAQGYRNLSAGLAVGLACAASGVGISMFMQHMNKSHPEPVVGDRDGLTTPLVGRPVVVRTTSTTSKSEWVSILLSLCFLEAIGLYGLIVALFLVG